ncbi:MULTISPECIES: calcium-binding protein [unclassified Halomonas]|uniref:calcium-binding protein n=1 Tax=unclassified Halomonas TaxID=2609666 RepID=UPI0007D93F54|nr:MULTISPECIES: calcium-binding protein [unclassified Halomonas]MBT2786097.1 calcium-binding protein [Halomonas sp. ISL-106]MBT2797119.1 calcium-binding protein [Halomonas sp. ISL-104]OAL58502.1 hypothetical protein A6R74_06305 [Halomonas sp. ALS9]
MAMFDYKNHTSEASAELLMTTHKLAAYASLSGAMGIGPSREIVQGFTDQFPDGAYPSEIDTGLPAGWRELSPAELGLPESALDAAGHYTIDSPVTGTLPTGPQAKLLGEFNEQGQLTRVSLTFTGTNSPVDIIDYLQLNAGTIAPNFEPLLVALKNYSQANGLEANDVLITGYSLGGGMANIMARFREELADGFFAEANYIGHASPLIYDDPEVVYNYGYENDAVHRVAGSSDSLLEALQEQGPLLSHPDTSYQSSTDNIVLFNDMYASPLWPLPTFSLLNIPVSWYAHVDGLITNAIQRIADSPFYEYTDRESAVIVSNLSSLSRSTVWVEDKQTSSSNHFGQPAFLIGSEHADKIRGGESSDYIYAGGGDDLIRLSSGADRVDGGSGINTLRLKGNGTDWDIHQLSDGTLFFNSKQELGLKQVENVSYVEFEGLTSATGSSLINQRYSVGEEKLVDERFSPFRLFKRDLDYREHVEGDTDDNELSGAVVFGGAGNDTLTALEGGSLLHGGEGDDTLMGGLGNDQLYGGEGNDTLIVRGGNDVLYGGIGDDLFVFDEGYRGSAVIKDFNQHAGDQDWLVLASGLFEDQADLLGSARQIGNDVVISRDELQITVEHIGIAELNENSLLLA